MAVTRPYVCEITLAGAHLEDDGSVRVELHANNGTVYARELTADEARELATEITTAAAEADAYAAERRARQ